MVLIADRFVVTYYGMRDGNVRRQYLEFDGLQQKYEGNGCSLFAANFKSKIIFSANEHLDAWEIRIKSHLL